MRGLELLRRDSGYVGEVLPHVSKLTGEDGPGIFPRSLAEMFQEQPRSAI